MSSDFMAACLFLKDHMDNMDNPNDDMVSRRDSSTEANDKTWDSVFVFALSGD